MEKLYTSGKAAEFLTEALGRPIRRRHIRELCRHGLAEGAYLSDRTSHWMIPLSTIERWKRAGGPPPIPSGPAPAAPLGSGRSVAPRSPEQSGRLAESAEVIKAAEDLAIAERRVQTRALELKGEEIEDKFRERASKEGRAEAERQEAEGLRHAQEEQRRLVVAWCEVAIGELPADFPLQRHADVLEKLRARLSACDLLTQSDQLTEKLIESVIASFVGPWEREEKIARLVENSIPLKLRYDPGLNAEAQQAAWQAVKKLGADSGDWVIRGAVELACQPLLMRLEHEKNVKRVLDGLQLPYGVTSREIADARDSVEEALSVIVPGSPQRKYEAARDRAISPHVEALQARQEREAQDSKKREQERSIEADRALREKLLDENYWENAVSLSGLPVAEKKRALREAREALEPLPFGTPARQVREILNAIFDRFKAKHRVIEFMNGPFGALSRYLGKLNGQWELDRHKSLSAVQEEVWKSIELQLYEELDGTETQEKADKLMRQLVREELNLR